MINRIHFDLINGHQIVFLTIFTGSVFITSGKFVSETNTPKLYFVLISLFVAAIILALSRKRVSFDVRNNKAISLGLCIVVFFQACYGLLQYIKVFPSYHSKFPITGSFDNPAGFAAVLAMAFPLALFFALKSQKIHKYLFVAMGFVIALAVFLSGSRTGMLSIIFSISLFFFFRFKLLNKWRSTKSSRVLILLIPIFLIVTGVLYFQKKDSANGRLLIWKISADMIKDRPLLGHGSGAFQAKYMDYQAEYFKNNPDSKFALLADNVKHPFNEFIKMGIEFGLPGLSLALFIAIFILRKVLKSALEDKVLILCGLSSFLIFACFSYPLQYVPVYLLLAYYLILVCPVKAILLNNSGKIIHVRTTVVLVSLLALVLIISNMYFEMKWNTIAKQSLKGETELVLPEYEKLYAGSLKRKPLFLYNYGAELNYIGQHEKSNDILKQCEKQFNDYDLQMLIADNYYQQGESEKAIEVYKQASNMIPNRFLPLYQLFKIYKESGQTKMALQLAHKIKRKTIKVPSVSVYSIINQAEDYLESTP